MIWITSGGEELRVIEQMASFPDRVVAIVCAALLEARLDKALKRRLLDDPKGKLVDDLLSDSRGIGTIGTKNRLAFALGIYSHQVMRDVHQVKQIRNIFAHELAIDRFDMSPVIEHCQSLKLVDHYVFDNECDESSFKWRKGLTSQMENRDRVMAIPRMRFQTTVALITTGLYLDDQTAFSPAVPAF